METPPSEFCPISGDWGELGLPNLARTPLIKCYLMLQNARVTALIACLLKDNQQGGKITPTQIGINLPKKCFDILIEFILPGSNQYTFYDIIYNTTAWLTNNCNTHIVQYPEK